MNPIDPAVTIADLGRRARIAARGIARSTSAARNEALRRLADAIEAEGPALVAANALDLEAARQAGLDPAFVDRLAITDPIVAGMAAGVREVAALADPIGEITDLRFQPSGIQVGGMRVPLGVIGIIYESRPNVTVDAAILCIKSGNATILRGGSEAIHSNRALAALIRRALVAAGLPEDAVQLVGTTDRAAVGHLIADPASVDVIIPRGGKSLIERISREAKVPVIKHLDGICHVYVDSPCDIDMAIRIADNAKTQRYSPCNTMETLLVHRDVAAAVLPRLGRVLADKGVELRGCADTRQLLEAGGIAAVAATAEDWTTEYLAPILSIRIVDDLDAAIDHINDHGSHHTDAIVTNDHGHAMRFLREVDSASVMINASTRFADGFEFGLGAEIGISTDKLHARGPVGLEGLTSRKFIVLGSGQVRGATSH